MDANQINKLIEAAEICKTRKTCELCDFDFDCPIIDAIRTDEECTSFAEMIIALSGYAESRIKSERLAVIVGIRYRLQLRRETLNEDNDGPHYRMCLSDVCEMLDEMEAHNG